MSVSWGGRVVGYRVSRRSGLYSTGHRFEPGWEYVFWGFLGESGFVWGCSSVQTQCGIVRIRSCAKAPQASNEGVTDGVRVDSGVQKSIVLTISRAQHDPNIRRTHMHNARTMATVEMHVPV